MATALAEGHEGGIGCVHLCHPGRDHFECWQPKQVVHQYHGALPSPTVHHHAGLDHTGTVLIKALACWGWAGTGEEGGAVDPEVNRVAGMPRRTPNHDGGESAKLPLHYVLH